MANENCKEYLKAVRKQLKAKYDEKIDKRYKDQMFGYLAPNDKYYKTHCGHCAEVEYLLDIYK